MKNITKCDLVSDIEVILPYSDEIENDICISNSKVKYFKQFKGLKFLNVIYGTLATIVYSSENILMLDGHFFVCFAYSLFSKKKIYLTCTESPRYYSKRYFIFKIACMLNKLNRDKLLLIPRTVNIKRQWNKIGFRTFEYCTWELDSSKFIPTNIQKNGVSLVGQLREEKFPNKLYEILGSDLIIAGTCHTKFTPKFNYIKSPNDEQFLNIISTSRFTLCLYSNWDLNKESGIFFQALMAGTPIISFNDGWLANQIKLYNVGVLIERNCDLKKINQIMDEINEIEYQSLLRNIENVRSSLNSNTCIYLRRLISTLAD